MSSAIRPIVQPWRYNSETRARLSSILGSGRLARLEVDLLATGLARFLSVFFGLAFRAAFFLAMTHRLTQWQRPLPRMFAAANS